jgi:signal transduction histidine kinase
VSDGATAGLPEDPAERLSALVHDLRTPLTVVAGFAELLETRAATLSQEQRDEFLERIAGGARQMRAILDEERDTRPEG